MTASDEQTRTQWLGLCRELVGAGIAEALVRQIVRVLFHVVPRPEQREKIHKPPDIVQAFKTAHLIPDGLVALCSGRTGGLPNHTLAVCFAASVYPQRADQEMSDRSQRVTAFLDRLWTPFTTAEAVAADVLGRVPQPLDMQRISDLLADLSAANCIPQQAPSEEEMDRRMGAACYLTTCHQALLEDICRMWLDDRGFVRYLREMPLATPPSQYTQESRHNPERPFWDGVKAAWVQMCPEQLPEHSAAAVTLEAAAWNAAWRQRVPSSVIPGRVEEFWTELWNDKLASGFPYYAFHAPFPAWWQACLKHAFPDPRIEPLPDDGWGAPVAPPAPPAFQLILEQLRQSREGICLVLTTFFRRADKRTAHGDDPVDDAEANDRVRQAVRELWRYRLANQIGDDDLPPAKVQEIAARFPDLGDDAINDYSHRLRFRLWAYQLARLDKLSNSQIRTAKRPPAHAHRGATMFPLYNEPGIQTIASLARTAPPRRTLLWAFTAHVFLHPKVEPQRPDPWTFKRYVRELWYWVTDAMFEDAVQQGAADGCCADRAAAAAMQQTPLQELWQALRRCTTEAELERFLQEPMVTKLLWELWRCATEAELEHAWHQFPFRDLWHELRGCTTETELRRYQQEGRDFRREEEAAYAALQHLIGDVGLQTCSADSLGVWRKTIGRSGYHWIVPVWFLTVVEQLNEQQLLTRLQVDDHEEEAVVRLARAIAARYAGPRGGGDQAVPGDSGAVHQPVYARQSGHGGQQRSAKGHPMDLAEAKEIIAAYLMGRSVMRQDLEHACERARSDARYVQYLAEELWIHADWGSECEAFLSQVTEFAAMSQAARQQTMPTSLAHVEACLSCRQAYWNVRPLWVVAAVVATKERARTIGKRLSEPIRLAVSKDGRLAERGCGPFSRTPALIPVPLLAPEEPEQKEWVLQDEDGQYAIRLVVCGLPSGRVMVSCTLQGEPSTLPQAQQVRIEVCKAESSSLYAAATLKGDQLQPIQLPPGSWVLRLEAPSPTGSRTWEIPVDIETEQAGERR